VHGRPFLDYQIGYLRNFGFKKFVLSTGFRAQVIEDYYAVRPEIKFIREDKPLGTGGAIMNFVRNNTTGQVLALNGDTLFLMDYYDMIKFSSAKNGRTTIALKHASDNSRYGSVRLDSESRIATFSEKSKDARNGGLINAGIYLFDVSQLADLAVPEVCSLEHDIFPLMLKSGIFGFNTEADFIDIGTPETLVQIEEFVTRNNIAPL
jgi:D-glycero-alpha-D-manno-heptose 1-phosphate guanylyltransferase